MIGLAKRRRVPFAQIAMLVIALASIATLKVLQSRSPSPAAISYSTYDASSGGYRAWYELLEREGVNVGRFEERAAFLDQGTSVLVVTAPPLGADLDVVAADGAALGAWVRDGARLVVIGSGPIVDIFRPDLRLPKVVHGGSPQQVFISSPFRRFGVSTYHTTEAARLAARPSDVVVLRDARGNVAVRYRLGRGEVFDVVDGSMFSNAGIARPDSARLAYALIALTSPANGVRVRFDEALHGYVTPEHWWNVLPRRLVAAIIIACAVLAIALVGTTLRLGPPLAMHVPRAPPVAEYLDAVAALKQRTRARDASLHDMNRSMRRLLASALDVAEDAPAETFAARMAAPLGNDFLTFDDLSRHGGAGTVELIGAASLAQTIRKEYASRVDGR